MSSLTNSSNACKLEENGNAEANGNSSKIVKAAALFRRKQADIHNTLWREFSETYYDGSSHKTRKRRW